MSQVIRISNDLYKRLEEHATGFDTPSNVIERVLNFYEGIDESNRSNLRDQSSSEGIEPATELEIVYYAGSDDDFKNELLSTKLAYIKLHYTNGQTEVKKWNAARFTRKSRVDGNLRSGYLRGWKGRGIYKAELSVNRDDIA
jgi:hypothetical protein